ncbi:MAG: hypothetical protein AAF724_15315 [Pseudomonadota bacterium]
MSVAVVCLFVLLRATAGNTSAYAIVLVCAAWLMPVTAEAQNAEMTATRAESLRVAGEGSVPLPIPAPRAVALVRDALAAVNHANWTGNYTVLRDYASPNFAAANDPARLSGIFNAARAARLDLFPAMVIAPVFTLGQVTDGGRLRLAGFVPVEPRSIRFDLIFEPVDGRWRLFGVSVGQDTAPVALQTPSPPIVDRSPQPVSAPKGPRTVPVPAARPPIGQ